MCKTNFSRTRFQLRISFLSILLLLLSGCATMIAPKEETLSLSGRYHDVIKLIEAKEARGEDLSLRERYRLCEAYLQAPVFRKLFPCVDQLERQLEAESDHIFSWALSPCYKNLDIRIRIALIVKSE